MRGFLLQLVELYKKFFPSIPGYGYRDLKTVGKFYTFRFFAFPAKLENFLSI
jgi:hypothetical protein